MLCCLQKVYLIDSSSLDILCLSNFPNWNIPEMLDRITRSCIKTFTMWQGQGGMIIGLNEYCAQASNSSKQDLIQLRKNHKIQLNGNKENIRSPLFLLLLELLGTIFANVAIALSPEAFWATKTHLKSRHEKNVKNSTSKKTQYSNSSQN